MGSWESAQHELDRLLDAGDNTWKSVPERIESLVLAQQNAPITSSSDAAAAIRVGLAYMGVGLEEDCAGRALIRSALKFLTGTFTAWMSLEPWMTHAGLHLSEWWFYA